MKMKVDVLKNYIAHIEASVGSEMFRHLYVITDKGEEKDVTNDGELSCAIHVSSVLTLVGLIDKPHATVGSTLAAIQRQGWVNTESPQPGAIIHWPKSEDGHEHLGFWLDDDKVVSNSTNIRVPVVHTDTMTDGRTPIAYYIYPYFKASH